MTLPRNPGNPSFDGTSFSGSGCKDASAGNYSPTPHFETYQSRQNGSKVSSLPEPRSPNEETHCFAWQKAVHTVAASDLESSLHLGVIPFRLRSPNQNQNTSALTARQGLYPKFLRFALQSCETIGICWALSAIFDLKTLLPQEWRHCSAGPSQSKVAGHFRRSAFEVQVSTVPEHPTLPNRSERDSWRTGGPRGQLS